MMTKDEALKVAIEAFVRWEDTYKSDCTEVINACKEALEQPAWQGLTDDEIDNLLFDDFGIDIDEWFKYARAIEANLKEKNANNT